MLKSRFMLIAIICFLIAAWCINVDNIVLKRTLSQHPKLETQQQFAALLLPGIKSANQQMANIRRHVLALQNKFAHHHKLSLQELRWLGLLYQFTNNINVYDDASWQQLMQRVDIVPAKVIKAQLKTPYDIYKPYHYNPFGMQCYIKECLLYIPTYRVKYNADTAFKRYFRRMVPAITRTVQNHPFAYVSKQGAILDYLWTVNTNPAFKQYRDLRMLRRQQKKSIKDWASSRIVKLTRLSRIEHVKYYQR